MNQEHLAKEAARLLADEILAMAFDAVKAEALEALAVIDAGDRTMILRWQQRVAAVEEIRSELSRYILAGALEPEAASYA